MLVVPTQAVANQTFQVLLAGQACQLNLYQTSYGLFMDVNANGALILGGVLCKNLVAIIRNAYFGFTGDFAFVDMQGLTDPIYTGLGARYLLLYLSPSDLTPPLA